MDIQKTIAVLFHSREIAHRMHLNTTSFSKHMALGEFYIEVISMADKLAEAWMGRNGKRIGEIPILTTMEKDPLKALEGYLEVLEEGRDFLGKDTPLQNIMDEIVGLYLSTLYKLKELE